MSTKTCHNSCRAFAFFAAFICTTGLANDVSTPPAQSLSKISAEPITLDIHFHYHDRLKAVYNNDWGVEKQASSITGISLNNVTVKNAVSGNEAFNLLMASGELPDIVGGTGLRERFNQYGPSGHFLPLNNLIEEHAPYLKSYFDNNPNILKAISAADGNLYHIPYVPDGKFGRAYFVRTDWLEKLDLPIPDNIDELYKTLVSFKTLDPNGNGEADEIPFFARNVEELIRLVTLWDARTTGSDTWHDFYISDGIVRHGYVEENYRTGMSHLAKWYSEGLIDKDVYTRTGNVRTELLGSNRGGMTHDWFASTSSYNERLHDEIPDFAFKPFAPPLSVSGKRIEEHRRTAIKPDGWAITKTNKHVIETIKYFDFWFSPQGKRLANFGVEGQEYTMINGKPVFTDEVLNGDMPVNARLWTVGAQVPRGFPQDYEYEKQWTNEIALAGIELYEKGDFLLEPFHGVSLNTGEKEIIDFYWKDILAFMLERQADWLLGLRDVNDDWDNYLARIEKLGFKKVMDVMQSAYTRQYTVPLTAEVEE